jgi:hypothetical protein
MALFEVFMVYGENRDNPEMQHKFVVADGAKQAELKSGLVADLSRACRTGPACHD